MRARVLLFPSCFVYYCIYFKSKYIYNNMSSIYVLHCAFIRLYEADWQSFYRNWTERTGQMRHIHCKSAHIYLRLPSAAVTRTTSTHTSTHTDTHKHTQATHKRRHIKQKLAQCVQIFVVWLKETLESIMPSYISICTDKCDRCIYVIDVYINTLYICTLYLHISISPSAWLGWPTWLDFLRSSDRKFSLSLSFISFSSLCYLSYTIYICVYIFVLPCRKQTARN